LLLSPFWVFYGALSVFWILDPVVHTSQWKRTSRMERFFGVFLLNAFQTVRRLTGHPAARPHLELLGGPYDE